MDGRSYPATRLNDAWNLVLGGQFHDTGGGTASPRAYEFAQNDEVIALNQFADVLTDATQSVAYKLDTRSRGVPVVVFNSLNIEREDVVEATLPTQVSYPKGVRVFAPNGGEVAAQIEG